MIIYYEELSDVHLFALSTNGRDTWVKRSDKKEWASLEFICSLLKQVKLEERDFNEKTKIWTILGFKGNVIKTNLESMCLQGLFGKYSEVVKIEDLEDKAARGALNEVKSKEKKYSQEDFFYNPNAISSSTALTGQALVQKLAPLLSLSSSELTDIKDDKILKKHYRVAALKLHPDRNNGDGSKMSELNMLWSIYTNQGVS